MKHRRPRQAVKTGLTTFIWYSARYKFAFCKLAGKCPSARHMKTASSWNAATSAFLRTFSRRENVLGRPSHYVIHAPIFTARRKLNADGRQSFIFTTKFSRPRRAVKTGLTTFIWYSARYKFAFCKLAGKCPFLHMRLPNQWLFTHVFPAGKLVRAVEPLHHSHAHFHRPPQN